LNSHRRWQARHEQLIPIGRQLNSTFDLDALLNLIIDAVCKKLLRNTQNARRFSFL
jgi:hypothetical protein